MLWVGERRCHNVGWKYYVLKKLHPECLPAPSVCFILNWNVHIKGKIMMWFIYWLQGKNVWVRRAAAHLFGLWIPSSGLARFRQEILIRLFVSLIAAKRIYRKTELLIFDLLVPPVSLPMDPERTTENEWPFWNEWTDLSSPYTLSSKHENKRMPFQRLSK